MSFPFKSTHEIVGGLNYRNPEDFGSYFSNAFDAVRGQILKFELKQEYREPGKPYDKAISNGNLTEAKSYIPGIIEDNKPVYDMLKSKSVEFIRCRPIKIPATNYLKWELLVYHETSKYFEDIYWCHYNHLDVVFENYACHDFMVFDARMALVQDYDDQGLLKGGWFVDDTSRIIDLISLFAYIKANCLALELLKSDKLEI